MIPHLFALHGGLIASITHCVFIVVSATRDAQPYPGITSFLFIQQSSICLSKIK